MGKKPVVGLMGLVWAGIALTGCGECCRNTRTPYSPKPAWQTKESVAPKVPVTDTKGAGMELPPAKPPEVGGPGSISEAPTAPPARPAPMPSAAAPRKVDSLRPAVNDGLGELPPLKPVEHRSRETGSMSESSRDPAGVSIPARPVLPRSPMPVDSSTVTPSAPPIREEAPPAPPAPSGTPGELPPPPPGALPPPVGGFGK